MKHEGSLSCSQEPDTGLYLRPYHEFSPQSHHKPCKWALASSRIFSLEDSQQISFYRVRLSASRPAPSLEDQVSVFISPGGRVAQAYPWTLGSSGTSGSPFPIPTYVGLWGDILFNAILISYHLRLGLPSELLTQDFPTETWFIFAVVPVRTTCPVHLILLDLIILIITGKEHKSCSFLSFSFLHPSVVLRKQGNFK
jgi:hypothetical protein